ncbi:uncharacterized protein SCHCODRAFT_02317908 [Schizophyllum commune H4-8]|uniref:uncharacterized protein n=1 Tax=Schizophyllum commune (strain H4-8 / FGSC 9210) TaxID=578458 RepID=UPI00215E58AE|nr:uncharacterized protein SCHCODRAFT_02317908 [Schizophyllum commune H4-8]KAI5891368.1 hypothetical protein SCHCODRAFT_02317908 [Schizophyllum commune H4-8]
MEANELVIAYATACRYCTIVSLLVDELATASMVTWTHKRKWWAQASTCDKAVSLMPSDRHLPIYSSNDSSYASLGSMHFTEQAVQRLSRRSAEPHNIKTRDPPVNSRPLKPVSHGEHGVQVN